MKNILRTLISGVFFIGIAATIFAAEAETLSQSAEPSREFNELGFHASQTLKLSEPSPLYAQIYTTYYPPIYSPPVVVGPTITTYYPAAPVYVGPPVIVRPWRPFLNAFLP